MNRPDGRALDQLRPITFLPGIAPHANGSVLVSFGDTRVICSAMIEERVPRWMKDQNVKGGLGIMLDDIVAAILAIISYYFLLFYVIIDIVLN